MAPPVPLRGKYAWGVTRLEVALGADKNKRKRGKKKRGKRKGSAASAASASASVDPDAPIPVAQLVAHSARMREESRGVHYREDFPDRDDSRWQHDSLLRMSPEDMAITDAA